MAAGNRGRVSFMVTCWILDGDNPHQEPEATSTRTIRRSPGEVTAAQDTARFASSVIWHAQFTASKDKGTARGCDTYRYSTQRNMKYNVHCHESVEGLRRRDSEGRDN
jgi:hypothetical protein